MGQGDVLGYLGSVFPRKKTARQIAQVLGCGVQSVCSNLAKLRCSELDGFGWEFGLFGGKPTRYYWYKGELKVEVGE